MLFAVPSLTKLIGIFILHLLLFFCENPWQANFQRVLSERTAPNPALQPTTANPNDEVQKMISDLGIISGPTMDVSNALKQMTKASMPYLQAIHPVSSLAAAGMKTVFKPSTDEFDAMVYLNLKITERFAEMDLNIEQLRTSISYELGLRDYGDTVTLRLLIIKPLFLRVIDPTEDPPLWREDFVKACESTFSPLNILHWINFRVNEYCTMPTACESKVYTLINEVFFDIENRLEDDDQYLRPPAYERYKKKMIVSLSSVPMKKAKRVISKLRAAFSPNITLTSFDDILMVLRKNNLDEVHLDKALTEHKWCLLKQVIEANHYKRDALLSLIEIVRRDVVRLETIAGMCANITTNGSEKKMSMLFNEINSLVVGITTKMDKWAERKLALTWPDVTLLHAKAQYRKVLRLTKYLFNQTAHRVLHSANERGPREYLHSVLISRNWEQQEWFWAPCSPRDECIMERNWRGTNLVITRHPMLALNRTIRAHSWLQTFRQNITDTIATNWKTDSLPWLLDQINATIGGGIRDPSLFANVVFIHNSKIQADKCVINYGIAGTYMQVPNLTSFERIDYFSNSWIPTEPDAENFKLFFFL